MKIKLDPIDILFSEFIRKRAIVNSGGCEYCGKQFQDKVKDNGDIDILPAWRQLECSHFKGRRRKSVRWNIDNAMGICFSCHIFLGENPDTHTEFFYKRLGYERFNQLNIRANTIIRYTKQEKDDITAKLKEKIKLLEWWTSI